MHLRIILLKSYLKRSVVNLYQHAFLAPLPGKVARQLRNIDRLILSYVIEITINPCSSRITLVCLFLYIMQGNKRPVYNLPACPNKIRRNITNPILEKEVDVTRLEFISQVMGTKMLHHSQILECDSW